MTAAPPSSLPLSPTAAPAALAAASLATPAFAPPATLAGASPAALPLARSFPAVAA